MVNNNLVAIPPMIKMIAFSPPFLMPAMVRLFISAKGGSIGKAERLMRRPPRSWESVSGGADPWFPPRSPHPPRYCMVQS